MTAENKRLFKSPDQQYTVEPQNDRRFAAQPKEMKLFSKGTYPILGGHLEHGLPEGIPTPFKIELMEKDEDGKEMYIHAIEFVDPNKVQNEIPENHYRVPYTITEMDIEKLQDWLIKYEPAYPKLQNYFSRTNSQNNLPNPVSIAKNLKELVDIFDQHFPRE